MGTFRSMTRITGIMIMAVCALSAAVCLAEEKAASEFVERTLTKRIAGEVSGISPRFIALVYASDNQGAYEMPFDVDKNTIIEHKKSLSEIKLGDTVEVTYEEKIETDGKVTRSKGRTPKMITYLRPAPPEMASYQTPDVSIPEPVVTEGE